MTQQRTDRTVLTWLLLASVLAPLLGVAAAVSARPDISPATFWLFAGLESLLVLAPASIAGVYLGKKVGLGPTLLRALVSRDPGRRQRTLRMLLPSVAIGALIGVPLMLGAGPGITGPTRGEMILRAVSVGISEEILFRLGLMTVFVWLLRRVSKPGAVEPSLSLGNLAAALLFAAMHLPGHMAAGEATGNMVIGIVLFNTFAGICMGWLYARYGLLAAVLAHVLGDVVGYALPGVF